MDNSKILIELNAYNAITILAFCGEFVDDMPLDYKFQAIKEAVGELEEQLGLKLTEEHWSEIDLVNKVNQLIGKSPRKKTQSGG